MVSIRKPAASKPASGPVTSPNRLAKSAAAKASAGAPAKAGKPAPAVQADSAPRARKAKLVRDSFTIPKVEYAVIDALKLRSGKLGQPAKKSELLRAGIKALAAMPDAAFSTALAAVPAIKTGRPAKD